MKENRDSFSLRLDGGNLSFNFVNTVDSRHEEPLKSFLHNYSDLIEWARFAGAINSTQMKKLLQMSRINQKKADRVYIDSIQLREAMYQLVVSLINREDIPPLDMQLVNQWLARSFSNLKLTQSDNHIELDWNAENFGLESVLWPIIRSFVDLVTSEESGRIKQCSNCGWIFVDSSKNKSRRWCSMEICGNQVKARRYANRTRT